MKKLMKVFKGTLIISACLTALVTMHSCHAQQVEPTAAQEPAVATSAIRSLLADLLNRRPTPAGFTNSGLELYTDKKLTRYADVEKIVKRNITADLEDLRLKHQREAEDLRREVEQGKADYKDMANLEKEHRQSERQLETKLADRNGKIARLESANRSIASLNRQEAALTEAASRIDIATASPEDVQKLALGLELTAQAKQNIASLKAGGYKRDFPALITHDQQLGPFGD